MFHWSTNVSVTSERDESHLIEETVVIEPPPGQLLVIVGDDTHTFHPSAQSVVVGIGDNGSIQIAPVSLPGAHVVLSKTGPYWTGLVAHREVLINGQHRASFNVVEPVTCRFPGQEQSVTFLTESHRRGQTTELDPDVLRAGRAAAQPGDEQDATLRGLADASTMSPGTNTQLEEGELWPGDDLLAKLERAYGWPVGTLSRIRDGHIEPKAPTTMTPPAWWPEPDKCRCWPMPHSWPYTPFCPESTLCPAPTAQTFPPRPTRSPTIYGASRNSVSVPPSIRTASLNSRGS